MLTLYDYANAIRTHVCAYVVLGLFCVCASIGKLQQTCACLPANYTELFDPNVSHFYVNDPQLHIEDFPNCGFTRGARACPADARSYCDPLVALPSLAVGLDGLSSYEDDWVGLNVTAQCVTIDDASYTNYNNFGFAVLVTLQLFTLDAWEAVYNAVLQSTGWVSAFYFAAVVFLGGFFVINLVLAVVTNAFDDTKDDVEEEKAGAEAEHIRRYGRAKKKKRDAITAHISPGPRKLQTFLESDLFVHFITVLIVVNTIAQACWYPRMTESQDLAVSILNYILGAFFCVEFILKIVAYGVKDYFFYHPVEGLDPEHRSGANWNRFDFLIVLASLTEVILHYSTSSGSSQGLSVLRVFRAVRLAKLIENWHSMQKLVETIGHSLKNIGNLLLILIIVVYTFAALGMQMFRADYFAALNVTTYAEALQIQKSDPYFYNKAIPRWNFIDFAHSFMMVFRILCGEWIETLFTSWEYSNSTLSFLFFLVALIVGNFIILNLFVALLLGAFDDVEEEDEKEQRMMAAALKLWGVSESTIRSGVGGATTSWPSAKDGEVSNGAGRKWPSTKEAQNTQSIKVHPDQADAVLRGVLVEPTPLCCCAPAFDQKLIKFREKVMRFATHPIFEGLVLVAILSSTIMLAFDDHPNRDNVALHEALRVGNLIFVSLFVVEAIVKIFGFGWSGYFKNGWNLLDLFLVVIGIVGVAITAEGGSSTGTASIRTLRALRALRPLRAIRRWESMRVVVDALLSSIPAIFNVIVFTFLVFLIFAIFGVQFFGGKFARCEITETGELFNYTRIFDVAEQQNFTTHKEACNSTFFDGFEEGEILWVNPPVNFDTTLQAFIALFQLATFEGWMTVLQAGQDATGIDMQPDPETQFYASIFFVVFIFFGSFFTLNLFIGVIIDNFQDRKKMLENLGKNGGVFLTKSQRRYLNIVRAALKKTPPKLPSDPVTSPIRHFCFKLSQSQAFELTIEAFILINTVFFTTVHWNQSETWDIVQWVANTVFVLIFTGEALIKLLGFGVDGYFRQPWNVFDFIIAVSSVVGAVIDMSAGSSVAEWANTGGTGGTASMLRLFRIVRLFRFFRFLKFAKNLRRLLMTLFLSLPSLLNIFTLFLLMITIFGLVGMSLFKDVVHNGELNDFVNFETFGSSFLLLFRLATAAGMDELMSACSVQIGCDENFYGPEQSNCGAPGAAKGYFVALVIVVFMIVINTYVAIILENMDDLAKEDAEPDSIPPEALSDFYETWARHDPRATHFVPYSKLVALLNDVPAPLGYKGRDSLCTIEELRNLRIPLYAGETIERKPTGTRSSVRASITRRLSTVGIGKINKSTSKVAPAKASIGRTLWKDPLAKDQYSSEGGGTTLTKATSSTAEATATGGVHSGELEAKAHCVSVLTVLIEHAIHIDRLTVKPEQVQALTDSGAASRYKHFRESHKPITNTFHYDPTERDDDVSVIELEDAALEDGVVSSNPTSSYFAAAADSMMPPSPAVSTKHCMDDIAPSDALKEEILTLQQ